MIFRKLAELGNPGMVSRWAAEIYRQIKIEHPHLSDYDIISSMLWIRFNAIMPNPEQFAAATAARDHIYNITDVVEFILGQEVDYFKNSASKIQVMNEVIMSQLGKHGVPHHMVFGRITEAR